MIQQRDVYLKYMAFPWADIPHFVTVLFDILHLIIEVLLSYVTLLCRSGSVKESIFDCQPTILQARKWMMVCTNSNRTYDQNNQENDKR
jgi:hypothetical protein